MQQERAELLLFCFVEDLHPQERCVCGAGDLHVKPVILSTDSAACASEVLAVMPGELLLVLLRGWPAGDKILGYDWPLLEASLFALVTCQFCNFQLPRNVAHPTVVFLRLSPMKPDLKDLCVWRGSKVAVPLGAIFGLSGDYRDAQTEAKQETCFDQGKALADTIPQEDV